MAGYHRVTAGSDVRNRIDRSRQPFPGSISLWLCEVALELWTQGNCFYGEVQAVFHKKCSKPVGGLLGVKEYP